MASHRQVQLGRALNASSRTEGRIRSALTCLPSLARQAPNESTEARSRQRERSFRRWQNHPPRFAAISGAIPRAGLAARPKRSTTREVAASLNRQGAGGLGLRPLPRSERGFITGSRNRLGATGASSLAMPMGLRGSAGKIAAELHSCLRQGLYGALGAPGLTRWARRCKPRSSSAHAVFLLGPWRQRSLPVKAAPLRCQQQGAVGLLALRSPVRLRRAIWVCNGRRQ